jgi:hypothetical protein
MIGHTFELCDICNNTIHKDCARITDDHIDCYACSYHIDCYACSYHIDCYACSYHIDCYACIGANENVVQIPETEHTTNTETLVKTIDTTSTNGCRQSHHGHSEDRMSTENGQ